MNKTDLIVIKWKDRFDLAEIARQNSIMGGASKKDISAIDAYIKIFIEINKDLKEIQNEE